MRDADRNFSLAVVGPAALARGPDTLAAEERGLWHLLAGRRRDDFLLGRTAAARAMAGLGAAGPVLRSGRRPRFPAGVRGSISHTGHWGAALATRHPEVLRVGVDIERTGRLSAGAAALVCCPAELEWAAEEDTPLRLTVLFSAKEAAYKALEPYHPLHPPLPRDLRVEVEMTGPRIGYRAPLHVPPGHELSGTYLRRGAGLVVTTAVLRATAPPGPQGFRPYN
ncbi:4'-phosphopantetheinyl transferase superfamily protein [Streptomyces xanthochromogenes]|uniref:4'-phosphopantetheinyl transferase family protein n=1 Tax=Streptomyces xanthochromogenes TaxID=67384 RepID=UPI00342AF034